MKEPFQSLVDLTEISEQDRLTLSRAADRTQSWADEYVKMFYDTLFDYPPTRARFREGERPLREETIRKWYLRVVRGEFDEAFWEAQWHIGQAHIERQILNSYMQGRCTGRSDSSWRNAWRRTNGMRRCSSTPPSSG